MPIAVHTVALYSSLCPILLDFLVVSARRVRATCSTDEEEVQVEVEVEVKVEFNFAKHTQFVCGASVGALWANALRFWQAKLAQLAWPPYQPGPAWL